MYDFFVCKFAVGRVVSFRGKEVIKDGGHQGKAKFTSFLCSTYILYVKRVKKKVDMGNLDQVHVHGFIYAYKYKTCTP